MALVSPSRTGRRQRGASLLFALIAMVALALAAVALTRSVNTGALVIGNLGFKQDTLAANDRAAEAAMAWIGANAGGTTLQADVPTAGYYATSLDALDPTGTQSTVATRAVVDWNGDSCAAVSGSYSSCLPAAPAITVNGNRSSYVITRLCATAGASSGTGNTCSAPLVSVATDDANRSGYDYAKPTGFGQTIAAPHYRIVVRTVGARGTVSFTETIVHF